MLIALITILLLGGGSSGLLDFIADTDDQVKTVVEKGERQKAARATVTAMKKLTNARNKQVDKSRKGLSKVLMYEDPTSSDIDAVWDTYFAEVDNHASDMLNLRFELRDQLTRDEWEQIFSQD